MTENEHGVLGNEMLRRERIAVVIPAFNESRFIGSVILRARKYAGTIIVIDDGSGDGTAEIAEAAGARVLTHPQNRGKGAALNTGFEYARAHTDAEVIVMIDADGQHNPDEIPVIVEPILDQSADVVVGSRFLDIKSDIPRWRQFGQHALTIATNIGSNSSITDSQSGFRAFSRRVLEVFRFDSRGFSVESEMQFMVQDVGLRVKEVAITCLYEEPPKRNPVKHGAEVISGLVQLAGQYRPLLVFGGAGIVVLAGGVLMGLYVVQIYNQAGVLATGYALISVLLSAIGMTAFSTGVILHSVVGLIREIKHSLDRSDRSS